jgi:hypothetical protein
MLRDKIKKTKSSTKGIKSKTNSNNKKLTQIQLI